MVAMFGSYVVASSHFAIASSILPSWYASAALLATRRALIVSQPMVAAASMTRPIQFRENFRIGRTGTVAKVVLVVKWGSCTFTRVKYLCALAFLTLCGVNARAQEVRPATTPAPEAELRGRLFERGSLTPLVGARVVTRTAETTS